ncbi:hypothetical protein KUCAC02_030102, partial [Chaenocephalus aceratus]
MGPRCLPLCHYRLLGRDGAMDGWLWGGGGCVVQCANINNGSNEGEETPGVKKTSLLCHDWQRVANVFKWVQTQMGSRFGGRTCVGFASGPWMAQLGAPSPLQTEVTGPL